MEKKFHELGDMCEAGELAVEEAHEMFKKFEDEMVIECKKIMDAEKLLEDDDVVSDIKVNDDPPGEGPILRWETRAVLNPGGFSWHPKNRKVKLAVTVKEFGLSKHQFRRLRELVGKRYHSGKDELTITSERYFFSFKTFTLHVRNSYSFRSNYRKSLSTNTLHASTFY